jgi:hypothetical protein
MIQAPTSVPEKHLLIVAGPSRSGTSLVTGLVSCLGFYIPQPEVQADKTNPKGFAEPRWAVDFHKRLMQAGSLQRSDTRPDAIDRATRAAADETARNDLLEWLGVQFQTADRVIVKDPRLVWFVDLYRYAAEQLGVGFGVIMMLRDPAETIRSADTAYGRMDTSTRAAGWINYALALERSSRAVPRALVEHGDLMADWRKALEAAEQTLLIDLTNRATDTQLRAASELVEPSLRRSHSDWTDLGVPAALQDRVLHTFQTLRSLKAIQGDADTSAVTLELDQLRETFTEEYQTALAVVQSSILQAQSDGQRRGRELAEERARAKAQERAKARELARAEAAAAAERNAHRKRSLTKRIARRLTTRT